MEHFVIPGVILILLAGQPTQATVVGMVRDGETGAAIAGALVALPDLERAAITDTAGHYLLGEVPAGPHHITIRFIGYAPRWLHALVPRTGELEINVSLSPQPLRIRTLEVRAPVIVRGLDGGDTTIFPDRECSIAAVRNHPLLAEPDVFQALGGGDVVQSPESPEGVNIQGGASDQTAYRLDGIPIFSPYHAAGVSSAWNPDALSRLHLASAAPSPAYARALSGAIDGVTRAPGDHLLGQGSVSTTQARLTFDGPLGVTGAGYLVSLRSGFAGLVTRKHETSHLVGETGDWLAKLETPAFGGRARLLGYGNTNEIGASAAPDTSMAGPRRRNLFEWQGRSLGAEWRRDFQGTAARVLGWSATGDASASWSGPTSPVDLSATRSDRGLVVAVQRRSAHATTAVELTLEQSRTSYRIDSDSASGPTWRLGARAPIATASAGQVRAIGRRLELDSGASLAATGGDLYPAPRARLRWNALDRLTFSGGYARTYQFAQSLRNAESVVGHVFPVEVYAAAGAPGVPVARSHLGVIAADYRPFAGVRLGLQAYARRSNGLLLVAPRDGEPFSTGDFAIGSGASRGLSLEAAASSARYGVVGSYGWQRVRLAYGDSSYVPEHGAAHLLDAGVIVFPTASTSLRLGTTAILGRRTTIVPGGLEWESCNLLDRGCEFAGSPDYGSEPLGAAALPSYFRVDVGLRQHWHLEIGGHDAALALFGTFTNVLGRKNLLTYARDPSTGRLVGIELRPRSPLVVGVDWRF